MSAVDQQITVEPILPATQVVVCNAAFTHALAVVEREIASLTVTDAQSSQSASNLLQRLTAAGVALEAARKAVKAPFLDKCKEIDAAAMRPGTRIEQAKGAVKAKIAAWHEEQARIAREAEVARQRELARLEVIRREEERVATAKRLELEEQMKAAQAAMLAAQTKQAVPVMDLGDDDDVDGILKQEFLPPKTETEKAIDAVKFAPAVAAAKPTGVTFKTRLVIESIDVHKLPDTFVTRVANETALRATFCNGWKEGEPLPVVPGVVFRIDKQVASTGRASF